jgi:hypothetical protein
LKQQVLLKVNEMPSEWRAWMQRFNGIIKRERGKAQALKVMFNNFLNERRECFI